MISRVKTEDHTAAGVLRLLAVLALGFGAAAFLAAGAFFVDAALAAVFFGTAFLGGVALDGGDVFSFYKRVKVSI